MTAETTPRAGPRDLRATLRKRVHEALAISIVETAEMTLQRARAPTRSVCTIWTDIREKKPNTGAPT